MSVQWLSEPHRNSALLSCSVVTVSSALTLLACSFQKVPLLHMSTHCPGTSLYMMSFTRISHIRSLQVQNAGVRSGYDAKSCADL